MRACALAACVVLSAPSVRAETAAAPSSGPVYRVANGRILIKPRMKYELGISMHVLKYAEDHHQDLVPWAERMRQSLPEATRMEALALIENSHEWQLGSLVQDYDGPDTIDGLADYVRRDKSGNIRAWAGRWDKVMSAVHTTPDKFPNWYAGFLRRYYDGGFGQEWQAGQKARLDAGAKDLADRLTAQRESPTSLLERRLGRRFSGKAEVIFYPSVFSGRHAYGFDEDGSKAVLFEVGVATGTVLAIAYHELMHGLIRGWWDVERMRAPIADLAKDPLFRGQWEEKGQGNYSYPEGWLDELIVHSLALYLSEREGLYDESSVRKRSYCGYEDALFDALFDRYDRFATVDDFIFYALTHIRATGEGDRRRFAYARAE